MMFAMEAPAMRAREEWALREIKLHGHRVAYRQMGSGPVIVLVHGITGDSGTWAGVAPWLAERYTVVAPDLLGHGMTAKPRGDYSLGAFASGIRDLMIALGHERGTFVGHSLGGGIALQLAYQFPERCERLVLVDSGGLGREVSLLLRAASLPGSEIVLPLLAHARLIGAAETVGRALGRIGLAPAPDLAEMARGYASLSRADARRAFVQTVRGVIDMAGQRVSARDRLYLAQHVPTLLIWGDRDPIIPIEHGREAQAMIKGSRFETFPGSGHFPHIDDPHRFVRVLRDFVASTEPANVPPEDWNKLLHAEFPADEEAQPAAEAATRSA
jgi:pimeloyl-ACP methyl ester carboxylesterase